MHPRFIIINYFIIEFAIHNYETLNALYSLTQKFLADSTVRHYTGCQGLI